MDRERDSIPCRSSCAPFVTGPPEGPPIRIISTIRGDAGRFSFLHYRQTVCNNQQSWAPEAYGSRNMDFNDIADSIVFIDFIGCATRRLDERHRYHQTGRCSLHS